MGTFAYVSILMPYITFLFLLVWGIDYLFFKKYESTLVADEPRAVNALQMLFTYEFKSCYTCVYGCKWNVLLLITRIVTFVYFFSVGLVYSLTLEITGWNYFTNWNIYLLCFYFLCASITSIIGVYSNSHSISSSSSSSSGEDSTSHANTAAATVQNITNVNTNDQTHGGGDAVTATAADVEGGVSISDASPFAAAAVAATAMDVEGGGHVNVGVSISDTSPSAVFVQNDVAHGIPAVAYNAAKDDWRKSEYWIPKLNVITHVTYEVAGATALFVTVVNFSMLSASMKFWNISQHLMNTLVCLIELSLNCLPVYMLHFPINVTWAFVYMVFTWIIVGVGLRFWPYSFLRADNSSCMIWYSMLVVFNFIFYSIWYQLSKWKFELAEGVVVKSGVRDAQVPAAIIESSVVDGDGDGGDGVEAGVNNARGDHSPLPHDDDDGAESLSEAEIVTTSSVVRTEGQGQSRSGSCMGGGYVELATVEPGVVNANSGRLSNSSANGSASLVLTTHPEKGSHYEAVLGSDANL